MNGSMRLLGKLQWDLAAADSPKPKRHRRDKEKIKVATLAYEGIGCKNIVSMARCTILLCNIWIL